MQIECGLCYVCPIGNIGKFHSKSYADYITYVTATNGAKVLLATHKWHEHQLIGAGDARAVFTWN